MTDIDDALIFEDDELAMLRGDFVSDLNYSKAMRHLVFVYGTMRWDERNHSRLHTRGVIYSGRTRTLHSVFDLRVKRNSNGKVVPMATALGGLYLRGEVYDVPGGVLQMLDICEGHPDVYQRRRVALRGFDDEAWIYLKPTDFDLVWTNKSILKRHGIHHHDHFNMVEYKTCQTEKHCSVCMSPHLD